MADKINKYKTLELVGKGAFGKVFRGVDTTTKQQVAIKVINLTNIAVGILKQNVNEIMMLSSIKSRYVCGFVDAFIEYTQSELWIVLEYCNAGSVATIIDQHADAKTKLPEALVWRLFIQLAVGLRTIHRYQIVHRDIKPSNLLLTSPNSTVRIADFNVSEMLESASSATIVGTPSYIAPEVWKSAKYSFACDIFSLGCIVYEMMTQKTAFYRDDVNELRDLILNKHPEKMPDVYSAELKNLVHACLVKDPDRRVTLQKLLQNPTLVDKAKQLQIDLRDMEINNFAVKRVTFELTKTYPSGKDGKEFHASLVSSVCNLDFGDIVREPQPTPRAKTPKKSKIIAKGPSDYPPQTNGKDGDRLNLPLKKSDMSDFSDKSGVGVNNHIVMKGHPRLKNDLQIILPGRESAKGSERKPPVLDTKDKLDQRETMTENKLRLLLKMQIKIVDPPGDQSSAPPSKSSHSVVPNLKFRRRVDEFSKMVMSPRGRGLKSGPHLSHRKPAPPADSPDSEHPAFTQIKLKTVKSAMKLPLKQALDNKPEGGGPEQLLPIKNAVLQKAK